MKGTNIKDGLGVQLMKDGSKYEGIWKDGKFHNKGRMTHANGDIYQGQWKMGLAHGEGTFMDTTGLVYSGSWENDMQHGQGEETWDYGVNKYAGNFHKGKKN